MVLLLRLDEEKLWVSAFFSAVEDLSGVQPPLLSVLAAGNEKIRFW